MRNVFNRKRFHLTVTAPSILWVLICFVFISVSVGWDNLFYFMPHEIAAIILSIAAPVFLFGVLFTVSRMASNEDVFAQEIHRHRSLIEKLLEKIDRAVEAMRKNWQFNADDINALKAMPGDLTGAIEALKAIPEDITSAFEAQNTGIEDITNKLTAVLRDEEEKARKIDHRDISRQTALMGMINVVLNDISVSVTRLLVRLMEKEGRSTEEIREYIQGLLYAFSTGDKGAFFRVLHYWLANNPKRIESLKLLAAESSVVSRDLSKILREMKEVISLVGRYDQNDIVKTFFNDNALWELNEVLEPHFREDGTAKESPDTSKNGK